jgi:RHS repeat-associated protein
VVNQVMQVYNGLGQMTGEYQSHAGPVVVGTTPEVQYTYNDMANGTNNSRPTGVIYPNGRVLQYNYNSGLDDSISRLSSISDSTGVLESYTYLGLGTVVARAHPQNGVNLTYISPTGATADAGDKYTGLDRFGRVVDQLWLNTNTGTATDEFQYTYDRDGNVLSKNNVVNPAFNEQYTYDNNNQLTSFTRGPHTQSWAYDAQGNWNGVTTDGTTQTRTANAQNEYTSVSGVTTPTYDNNGNLTTDPTTGNTYVYDAWNRPVAVQNGGSAITSYTYDTLGRRITESSSATTRDLYYNGQWQVIEERVSGQTQAQYVWDPLGPDILVERDSNPDSNGNLTLRLYAQQDANGDVAALVDTSGNVVERFVYDPYGQVTVLAPNWSPLGSDAYGWVYLFQAGRYDSTSGLYNFRNRDYSPALGRWLQVDPIGYTAGDGNLYRFCGNDPIGDTDPLGQQAASPSPAMEAQRRQQETEARLIEAKQVEEAKRKQFVKALNDCQKAAAGNPKPKAKGAISAVALYTLGGANGTTKTVTTVAVRVEVTQNGFQPGDSVEVSFGGAKTTILVTGVPEQDTVYFTTSIIIIGNRDPVMLPRTAGAAKVGGRPPVTASNGPIPAFEQK